jgi:beta-N-acetylhexosaminidase
LARVGVATTVKHFPGLGRVKGNTDFTGGVVDTVTAANDASLESFRQGIDAGAPFAMVALATYTRLDPSHLAVFSPTVMRLLRGQMGFSGAIVSDDLGSTAAVAGIPPGTRAVDFLAAGGDLVVSKTVEAALPMVTAILTQATADPIFRSRVYDAAARVLRAKLALGLLPCA